MTMSEPFVDFQAGFSTRSQGVAEALRAAFAPRAAGFAPADLRDRVARGPVSFAPQGAAGQEARPRHFSPADPGANPTEGWDPFTAEGIAAGVAAGVAAGQGFTDPVAAAREAGFAEGVAAALADHAETTARDRTLIADLAAGLRADQRLDRDRMAHLLRQTVLSLVSRLVGDVGISPDLLARRIDGAAAMLADAAESAMLRVHPDDVALLDGKLPRAVFAVGDAGVARGSFVLESASTIVEDGPDLWLEQLAAAVDRVAVPPVA